MNDRDLIKHIKKAYTMKRVGTFDWADYEIINLYNSKRKELESAIGTKITDNRHVEKELDFKGNKYLLSRYPIKKINKIVINDKTLDEEDYFVLEEEGIIRFKNYYNGAGLNFFIDYEFGWPQDLLDVKIYPLIYDMMLKEMIVGDKGDIRSIREGDVSVSYSPENNSFTTIPTRINELKFFFATQVDVI